MNIETFRTDVIILICKISVLESVHCYDTDNNPQCDQMRNV